MAKSEMANAVVDAGHFVRASGSVTEEWKRLLGMLQVAVNVSKEVAAVSTFYVFRLSDDLI